MKKLFLFVGVVAAMISCAKSDVYDVNESNPDVITFDASVGQTTKGTVFEQDDIEETGFGLMAYYTAQNAWDESEMEGSDLSFTPDFMYNQEVEYNTASAAWYYTPIKYWPNEDDDKVTFFAYAPYESAANKVAASYTANTAAGRPEIEFTLQDKAVDMIDFVAGQNMNMVRQQDKVTFNLKHQLTRATFSAITNVDNVSEGATANEDINKSADGYSYVVVKSMDIVNEEESNFYSYGIYTFDNETTDDDKTNHDQDGTWEVYEPISYSFETIMDYTANGPKIYSSLNGSGYAETGVVLPVWRTDYTSLFADGEYLFILPPNGADGMTEGSEVQVEIVYDIVTVDSKLDLGYSATESTYTVTLPATTLAQGKAYNYQLTFDVTEVLVEANVVDWDEEITSSAGTVDPYDDTVYNPITSLSIGADQTITVGDTITITPEVSYTYADAEIDDTLTWSCSLDCISITKDEDGNLVVTGKEAGESTITLTSKSGAKASVTITVEGIAPEGTLSISGEVFNNVQIQTATDDGGNEYEYTIVSPYDGVMHTVSLTATYTPEAGDPYNVDNVEWSIKVLTGASDGITVSDDGVVTGVEAGVSAVVTATYTDAEGFEFISYYFVGTLDEDDNAETDGFDAYLTSNTQSRSFVASRASSSTSLTSNSYLSSVTRSGDIATTVTYDNTDDTYTINDKTYYSANQNIALAWPANTNPLIIALGVDYEYSAYSDYIYIDENGKVYASETYDNIEVYVSSLYDSKTYNDTMIINVVVVTDPTTGEVTVDAYEDGTVATGIEITSEDVEEDASVYAVAGESYEFATTVTGTASSDVALTVSGPATIENGVVTLTGEVGTVVVTASVDYVSDTFTFEVVAAPVYASNVEITGIPEDAVTVDTESIQLGYAVSPEDADQAFTVAWTSSESDVATIDADGKVTIVGAGTTTITVTIADANGSYSDTFELTVSDYPWVNITKLNDSTSNWDSSDSYYEQNKDGSWSVYVYAGDVFQFFTPYTSERTLSGTNMSSIATVSTASYGSEANGNLQYWSTATAVGVGTITVNVTDSTSGLTTYIYINVLAAPTVDVTSISISGDSTIDLASATSATYTAVLTPENADSNIEWSVLSGSGSITADGGVLTVSTTGEVMIMVEDTLSGTKAYKTVNVIQSSTIKIVSAVSNCTDEEGMPYIDIPGDAVNDEKYSIVMTAEFAGSTTDSISGWSTNMDSYFSSITNNGDGTCTLTVDVDKVPTSSTNEVVVTVKTTYNVTDTYSIYVRRDMSIEGESADGAVDVSGAGDAGDGGTTNLNN